ncbi:MAG: saccharopine dehydrogenase C-terminal domain-containing protein [Candidatus Vecturithrix sp.]|jgi:saccharopine dehydrogenase-like NADP-dependent oxidoreductase|nr:saccharopine dehydrogenase C-terminal domain-containing protein [Candidatus Vecturithrix sp.]
MSNIVVLGAGMVGSAIAIDLCREHQVTLSDLSKQRLEALKTQHPLQIKAADLSKKATIQDIIQGADLVIGAVPGFMGFETLKTCIEAGKNVVDISFFDEDPFQLDELAHKHGVTVLTDCGVAPGMDNIILGYHHAFMEVETFECYVGGLPVKRSWPYEYKAPFSPIDVVEEYTRPARVVEDGKIVTKPAMSDAEYIEIDPIGTLEAFNTDGLRTLVKTMNVPNMKEKTLRYPGHIEYMRVLRETGLFGKDELEVKGVTIRPLDVTTALLFPMWKLGPGEEEFTVMHINVIGMENGQRKTYTYHMFDKFDAATKTSSMARTTGYTCTAAARLVLNGDFTRKGMNPPEYLGANANCFQKLLGYLEERNIRYLVSEQMNDVQ